MFKMQDQNLAKQLSEKNNILTLEKFNKQIQCYKNYHFFPETVDFSNLKKGASILNIFAITPPSLLALVDKDESCFWYQYRLRTKIYIDEYGVEGVAEYAIKLSLNSKFQNPVIAIYFNVNENTWKELKDMDLKIDYDNELRVILKNSAAGKDESYKPIIWDSLPSTLENTCTRYILKHYDLFESQLRLLPEELQERFKLEI